MSRPRVPLYFDHLIPAFQAGHLGRSVHLGHFDELTSTSRTPFAAAQARLDAQVLALAEPANGLRFLDVGCGFGGTLEALGRDFSWLTTTGVNLDARQLAICRGIAARMSNRHSWVQADAAALPFGDASFDRALSIEAMFHFSSRRAFYREVARVLAPGGIFAASDMWLEPSAPRDAGLEEALEPAYGPWPDLFSGDADPEALAASAGLVLDTVVDATAATLPSHRHTVPSDLAFDPRPHSRASRADAPSSPLLEAGLALRWLHENGHLRYAYLRCRKP